MDWSPSGPYSCSSWANAFGQTLPILDDNSGSNIYNLFGVGYVPHNVVIYPNGVVMYSEAGFNQVNIVQMIQFGLQSMDTDNDGIYNGMDNCPDAYNPEQTDTDADGIGDACDPCNNLVFTTGDLNADGYRDLIDILIMVDVILEDDSEYICSYEVSDINNDGHTNVLDVIGLVQIVLGGTTQQALHYLQQILTPREFEELTKDFVVIDTPFLFAWPNPSNEFMNIGSQGDVTIYDTMGRMVKQVYVNGRYRWNTKNVPSGIYYIINKNERITVTLLK